MERSKDSFRTFIKNYWNYYRELEDEFLATKKYVEFNKDNYSTYSIEYLKLFEAVCGEIDVVGKSLAQTTNEVFKADDQKNNILKWWYEIQDKYYITTNKTDILKENSQKIDLNKYECDFLQDAKIVPWRDFRTEYHNDSNNRKRIRSVGDTIPDWWSAYNRVKHGRALHLKDDSNRLNFSKANLKNLICAFAGLYVLETAYMESCGTRDDLEAFLNHSVLFEFDSVTTSTDINAMFL